MLLSKEEDVVATTAMAMVWCGWQTTSTQSTRVGIERHNESGQSEEEAVTRTAAVMLSSGR